MKGQTLTNAESSQLAQELINAIEGGDPVRAQLSTDEKVIARITDGIYRQPASALRELISNAYDADASIVSIDTDYPRFEHISIRDNGNGMGEEVLANLIRHIGGSAKRDSLGMNLGVTSATDSTRTILGRKIIGKIGIGLFSVAQLTQQFQIITKVKGNDYRLLADVTLKTFTENDWEEHAESEKFDSGFVDIRKIKAVDIDAHGTDIILHNLRKNALSILRSDEIWSKVDEATTEKERLEYKPTYHIGLYDKEQKGSFSEKYKMSLPWDKDSNVQDRFSHIYRSMLNEVDRTRSTPRLDNTFDNYFRTLWTLSLGSPIEYIDKHPFSLIGTDDPDFFCVSNESRGQVSDLEIKNQPYKDLFSTSNPYKDPAGGFEVFVDGVKLYRPIAFNNQKTSKNALQKPLMFYGKYIAPFDGMDRSISGGDLEFEAYFFWNSKILPLDHNGILIRINDASGTLHDSRWLGYPVAEKTTLGQITAEVFVVKGLDSALNIDRESFNYSHPHYQVLSKWVHNALRQITAKQKRLRSEKNAAKKVVEIDLAVKALYETEVARNVLDELITLPDFPDDDSVVESNRSQGVVSFNYSKIFNNKIGIVELEKLKLIVAVLESKQVFSNFSYAEQEELVRDLAEILVFGDR